MFCYTKLKERIEMNLLNNISDIALCLENSDDLEICLFLCLFDIFNTRGLFQGFIELVDFVFERNMAFFVKK